MERYFLGNDGLCYACRQALPFKVRVWKERAWCLSLFDYHKVRHAILLVKEQGSLEMAEVLTAHIPWRVLFAGAVIVPVPSREEDNQRRGHQHTTLIAKSMGLPVVDDWLMNASQTRQLKLKHHERHESRRMMLTGKRSFSKVLLVDDVYTTGATMRACLDMIRPHVKQVFCISLSKNFDIIDSQKK